MVTRVIKGCALCNPESAKTSFSLRPSVILSLLKTFCYSTETTITSHYFDVYILSQFFSLLRIRIKKYWVKELQASNKYIIIWIYQCLSTPENYLRHCSIFWLILVHKQFGIEKLRLTYYRQVWSGYYAINCSDTISLFLVQSVWVFLM